MIENYFKEQLEGGAKDQFFYGTEMNGEVRSRWSYLLHRAS
jgi:hypothetical protein